MWLSIPFNVHGFTWSIYCAAAERKYEKFLYFYYEKLQNILSMIFF